MNPFGFLHRERAHRHLRHEHETLTSEHETLQREHDEAVEALGWFKARYEAEYQRAEEMERRADQAETVVDCLDRSLSEEKTKVAALEKIAGPYVPADVGSPIFDQVTGEHPLPTFDTDSDETLNVPVPEPVRTLADALGARP